MTLNQEVLFEEQIPVFEGSPETKTLHSFFILSEDFKCYNGTNYFIFTYNDLQVN